MRLGLILGDQLTHDLASLRVLDAKVDRLIMAEVRDEAATYVKHHKQKIALLFSAMRHFAQELRDAGWQVDYYEYNSQGNFKSLFDVAAHYAKEYSAERLVLTQCGEYRLQNAMDREWSKALNIPVEVYGDDRFIATTKEFADWADGRKQLRMEYFYREMRRKTGYLMKDGEPEGGQWNYDADNRKKWDGKTPFPNPPTFERDDIDREVIKLVEENFDDHPGSLEEFHWATTRAQASTALGFFIQHCLTNFGDFQDAMVRGEKALFHSLLSPYLNCGLLTAKQVCDAAQRAWDEDRAPLNAVEGFIRQIIGWREFVRGIYWLKMPAYLDENYFNASRDLPAFYWTSDTHMRCMKDAIKQTQEASYAHHIQRLMITGNFALLAGVDPRQVHEWYMAVYIDAFEWVEVPNTLGMSQFADGGVFASKPYAASGAYINRLSNYCSDCAYNVRQKTESDACPFNALYWDFLARNRDKLGANNRLSQVYANWDRLGENKQQAYRARATRLLERIEEL